MLKVRKAVDADFEHIMEIYRTAQDYMIRSGNPDQWSYIYPDRKMVSDDIKKEICHVVYDDENYEVYGVFAVMEGIDPTYIRIYNGKWLNDEPYITIHRVASDGRKRGIMNVVSDYCKKINDNVRIDTHNDNKKMQSQILKNGFISCGTIYVDDGSARIAYQWCRNK